MDRSLSLIRARDKAANVAIFDHLVGTACVCFWTAGASLANNLVITRLSTKLNGGLRHYNDRSISAATRLLAVPTVAVQHYDWISTAFIMDNATDASG